MRPSTAFNRSRQLSHPHVLPGIWTNGTFDYIAPSIALARDYLAARAREDWTAEIEGMIADEAAQVERANTTSATPVVFVHGLWLLPSSWDRWVTLFEEAGYVGVTPGWPDDPETVAEAREHPEVSPIPSSDRPHLAHLVS